MKTLLLVLLAALQLGTVQGIETTKLSWQRLVEHAAIDALPARADSEYSVDAVFDMGPRIEFIRAEIKLTDQEWVQINEGQGAFQFLSLWVKGKISTALWKRTVDLGLPFEGGVDTSALQINDAASILIRPDIENVRLYILSPSPHGKGGSLFYFFVRHWEH